MRKISATFCFFLLAFSSYAGAETLKFKASLLLGRMDRSVISTPILQAEPVTVSLDSTGSGHWEKEIVSDGVKVHTYVAIQKGEGSSVWFSIQNSATFGTTVHFSSPGNVNTRSIESLNHIFLYGEWVKVSDVLKLQPIVVLGPAE